MEKQTMGKMKDKFGTLLLQLHEAGAEIQIISEEDEKQTLGELEKRKPASKADIEKWDPAHTLSLTNHLHSTDKSPEAFAKLVEQLQQEGVKFVVAEEEDHERPLCELKTRSPLVGKVLDAWQTRKVLCGWVEWNRHG